MQNEVNIKSTFILQQDQSDCGVACLASVVKFHGGYVKLETLREISGTSKQGTTLLGLYQAASQIGFDAEGFEADIENLKKHPSPCILHVIMNETLMHYIVCYGFNENCFIIGDPAKGIVKKSTAEIEKIWKSHALLQLNPGQNFVKEKEQKRAKLNWFLQLIHDDYNIIGIAALLGIMLAFLSMATAIFSQKLIDEILPQNHTLKLTVGLVLLAFLLFVKTGLAVIRENFVLRQSVGFNTRIIDRFYSALLKLPKIFFDTRKTGELIARMNDTLRIQNTITFLTGSIIVDVLIVIVSLIFIFSYSLFIGTVAALSIPIYFTIVYFLHDKIVNVQQNVMQAYAQTESNYVDTLQGISEIKVNNKENYYSALTKNIYGNFQQKIFNLGIVRIRLNLLSDLTSTTIILVTISWCSYMVLHQELKLGEMMAILTMSLGMMPSANRLALTNIQLQEAKVAFDRMFDFAAIHNEYDPSVEEKKEIINQFEKLDLSNISFRFPGRSQLLKDVSMSVKKGDMIALLGESGSGKSTTLQIMQRFYKYETGTVKVNGIEFENVSVPGWRNLIGVVPQQIKIFNNNLFVNICMNEASSEANNVINFCREYGFSNFFEKFPQNYSTILGEEGVNISGGQQQLVALARALYKKPQLLLLDEATSAMDRNTEKFIFEILKKIKSEMAIILVTHRIQTAKEADTIYVLENGIISSQGNHHELLKTKNLYSQTWSDLTLINNT